VVGTLDVVGPLDVAAEAMPTPPSRVMPTRATAALLFSPIVLLLVSNGFEQPD
jgi:hypothetical protein